MGIRSFFKSVWIFISYLVTQPFKEIWKLFVVTAKGSTVLSYTSSWRIPLLVGTVLAYLARKEMLTNFLGAILIVFIIKTEWDEKRWLQQYRDNERKRIEKKLAEQGVIKEEELK